MHALRRLLPFLITAPLAFAQEREPAVVAAPDPLPRATAEAIRAEGIDKSQVMRILRDLTSKIGHRLTGSDNFTKACEWASSEFTAMGFTKVHLDKWGEWKLAWNRGAWIGRITSPETREMYVATEAWTAGTKGLQSGTIVLAPASEEELVAESLAGKWVTYKKRPKKAVREACEKTGMLGWVYRAGDPDKKFPTRVRVFGDHKTAMKPLAEVPSMPEIAVRADDFDALFAMVEAGKAPVCEFDIQNTFRDGPIELNNVIAEIPGTEKPDEVVIVSAHLDSWHQVQGTTDNGTGTATTLEAARILMAIGAKPKRTIRFCLWGGEEQGLLGSLGYVQRHRTDMPKVSALFNHDTGTNWAQSLGVTAAMETQLLPVFARVNELLQAPDADWAEPVFALRVVPRLGGGMGGSDHASFLAAGVPGLDWGLKGRSNYFQHTWHTQWDTIDVAIEEYQRHTATVVAMAALGTANLDTMLDRTNVGGASGQGQSAALVAGWFETEMDDLKFTKVKPDGRAAKMGVLNGDVLTEVDGREVRRTRQVFQFARESEAESVTFTFARGDKTFQAKSAKNDLPKPPGQAPGGAPAPEPSTPPKKPAGGGTDG